MAMRIIGCFAWIIGGVQLCIDDMVSHGMGFYGILYTS